MTKAYHVLIIPQSLTFPILQNGTLCAGRSGRKKIWRLLAVGEDGALDSGFCGVRRSAKSTRATPSASGALWGTLPGPGNDLAENWACG